jgi:hypothetical protein
LGSAVTRPPKACVQIKISRPFTIRQQQLKIDRSAAVLVRKYFNVVQLSIIRRFTRPRSYNAYMEVDLKRTRANRDTFAVVHIILFLIEITEWMDGWETDAPADCLRSCCSRAGNVSLFPGLCKSQSKFMSPTNELLKVAGTCV